MGNRLNMEEQFAKWRRDYERWQESGETQVAYCRKLGVSCSAFRFRLATLRKKGVVKPAPKQKKQRRAHQSRGCAGLGSFLPMRIESRPGKASPEEAYCTISFRGAGKIIIESEAVIERFRQMMGFA